MKKLTVDLDDVEVKLIRFFDNDPYEGFEDSVRPVTSVRSEMDEIEAIQASKPIALFKHKAGSYILIQKKPKKDG